MTKQKTSVLRKVAMANKNAGNQGSAPSGSGAKNNSIQSADFLRALEVLRETRRYEEERFDEKLKEAVNEVKERSWFKCGVCFAAAGVVATILGYFAQEGVSCVIHNKVESAFTHYTRKEIDDRVTDLSKELRERIADCTNTLVELKVQSQLLRLHSLAVGGDRTAYDGIKTLAKTDEFARECLTSLDSYFSTFMNRMGHDSCINEKNWGYRRVDIPEEEKVRLIKEDPGLSKANLNLLIGLIAEAKDPKSYTGLVVRKADVCDNLFDLVALIDCICVWFDSCPKSPDLESLNKWWDENKRPEYDKFN